MVTAALFVLHPPIEPWLSKFTGNGEQSEGPDGNGYHPNGRSEEPDDENERLSKPWLEFIEEKTGQPVRKSIPVVARVGEIVVVQARVRNAASRGPVEYYFDGFRGIPLEGSTIDPLTGVFRWRATAPKGRKEGDWLRKSTVIIGVRSSTNPQCWTEGEFLIEVVGGKARERG